MATPAAAPAHPPSSNGTSFRYERFSYREDGQYVARITGFVAEAVALREPVLVAVPGPGLRLLRQPIAALDDHVRMVDMSDVGSNPGRVIGLWNDFLDTTEGRPSRGVGGPVPIFGDQQQLIECHIHERLLGLAFAGRPFNLLSPMAATGDHVGDDGADPDIGDVFTVPLPPSPPGVPTLEFAAADLSRTRALIRSAGEAAGLRGGRLSDLVLSVDEVATNAVTHGRADGAIRWWTEPGRFVCELSGAGRFTDPLVGRRRPGPDRPDGRGLWLAIQLCDLVQVRNVAGGTVVRLRLDLDA